MSFVTVLLIRNPKAEYDKRPFKLACTVFFITALLSSLLGDNEPFVVAIVIVSSLIILLVDFLSYTDNFIRFFVLFDPVKPQDFHLLSIEDGKIVGNVRRARESIKQAIELAEYVNDLVVIYLDQIEVRVLKSSDIDVLFIAFQLAQDYNTKVVGPKIYKHKRTLKYWKNQLFLGLKSVFPSKEK